jgi:hypothetical protein
MINRTNAFAGALFVGLLGLGLAQQYFKYAPAPATPDGGAALATVALPDIDGDKKADKLFVTAGQNGQASVMLTHTVNNRTGQMMTLVADGPLSVEGSGPAWRIKDASGAVKLNVRTFQPDAKLPPDLIVYSDTVAKRYFWMQRGFVKLDALTVTPGFAVGLVMVNDPEGIFAAIADAPDASGHWRQPIATELPLTATVREGRVKALTYDSPNYTCDFALAPGKPLSDEAKQIPSRRDGEMWISPTYGLIGEVDASAHTLRKLTVTQPWNEQDPANQGKQGAKKQPPQGQPAHDQSPVKPH